MNSRPVSQPVGPPRPPQGMVQVCADVKPRLTKDQHEILERHFAQQPKPSTQIKKGFAEHLGVPLDKINNWFQNRRAKVKQDAKKQMNAFHMLQATFSGQHPQQFYAHPQPVPEVVPQYYGPPPVVPSNTSAPAERVELATAGPQDLPVNVPLPPSRNGNLPQHEMAGQMPMMTSAPQGMAFPAQHFPNGFDQPSMLTNFDFGQAFSDFSGLESFPHAQQFMQQSYAGEMPMGTMPGPSGFPTPSASASPHTMQVLTSGCDTPEQAEDSKNTPFIDSPPNMTDTSTNHPTPAESTTTWSSGLQAHADFYEQQAASAPTVAISYDSPAPTDDSLRQDSAAPESVGAASYDQSSASESESSFRRPSASGLAARRQKPRPANLVSSALRSASYTAGMPGSPGANANPNSQDQLRRIRSHGIVNGRISKDARQKSPMHANFDAALNSPKFRHASNYSTSTISTNGPLTATTIPNSLAPPTPITPNDPSGYSSFHTPGGKMFYADGSPSAFSHSGEDAMFMPSTSPGLLDPQQLAQFNAMSFAQHESTFNTPPQSAPPMQQHFHLTPPDAHSHPMMMNKAGLGHMRKHSLPEASQSSESQGQWAPAPFGQLDNMPFAYAGNGGQISMADAMAMNAYMPESMPAHPNVPFMPGPLLQHSNPIHFHNQGPADFQGRTK